MSSWRYVFLLSSLPRLGGLDAVRSLPIGHSTLRDRLSVFEPAQLAALATVETLLQWPAGWSVLDDGNCLLRLREASRNLPHAALRDHCAARLQIMTVLGALRARRRGASVAPQWLRASGEIGARLKQRWSDPEFGLSIPYPWLGEVIGHFGAADWEGLERGLIRHEYAGLAATQAASGYGFEAVAAYVLRWELLSRWLEFDAGRAAARMASVLSSVWPRGESCRGT
jgi:hypothetical protein